MRWPREKQTMSSDWTANPEYPQIVIGSGRLGILGRTLWILRVDKRLKSDVLRTYKKIVCRFVLVNRNISQ